MIKTYVNQEMIALLEELELGTVIMDKEQGDGRIDYNQTSFSKQNTRHELRTIQLSNQEE